MHTTLIAASSDLARRTVDPQWLFVDCRHELAQPDAGLAAYRSGHIPGAVFAHLDRDLSGPVTPRSGRHPLPDFEQLATLFGRWGVTSSTQVVAYDADSGVFAARLWWLLRALGHHSVAVLDGGYKAWLASGLPISTEAPLRTPRTFEPHLRRDMWVDVEEVAARVAQADWRVLDARAPERYAGEVEPLDSAGGHVPGAVNHPFMLNLTADGRMRGADELAAAFDRTQAGVGSEHTIAMCGSGVTACQLLLAMEVAGKPGAKLYPGSWSEWIRDRTRPITLGRAPH